MVRLGRFAHRESDSQRQANKEAQESFHGRASKRLPLSIYPVVTKGFAVATRSRRQHVGATAHCVFGGLIRFSIFENVTICFIKAQSKLSTFWRSDASFK
jgi:hypothetical protein